MMRNIATTLYKEGPLGMWWGRWDLNPGSHAPQACILIQSSKEFPKIHGFALLLDDGPTRVAQRIFVEG